MAFILKHEEAFEVCSCVCQASARSLAEKIVVGSCAPVVARVPLHACAALPVGGDRAEQTTPSQYTGAARPTNTQAVTTRLTAKQARASQTMPGVLLSSMSQSSHTPARPAPHPPEQK